MNKCVYPHLWQTRIALIAFTACSGAKDFQYKVMQDVRIEKQYE